MVRFKIKFGSSTSRIEVPGTTCLFRNLKAAVIKQIFPVDPPAHEILQLSFNNRDIIQGDEDADIKDIGIAAGDILWVLSPKFSSQQEPDKTRMEKRVQEEDLPSAAQAPSMSKQCLRGEPGGCSVATNDEESTACTTPSYLLRVLMRQSSAGAPVPPTSPADVLLLAAHAAMLETGFHPVWASPGPPLRSASASADSPFGSFSGDDPCMLPLRIKTSSSLFSIDYILPDVHGSGAAAQGQSAGAQSAPTCAAGAPASVPAGSEAAAFRLQCSTMGPTTAVLVASTPGGHFWHIPLSTHTYLKPHQGGPTAVVWEQPPSTSAGARPRLQGGETSQPAPAPCAEPATGAAVREAAQGALFWDGQYVFVLGGSYRMDPEAVCSLWRVLKDELALPMLMAAHAEAGLPPPTGLLALPEDVKLGILQQLNALQLVAACSTCTQLRHLASQDILWKPLFEAEFPAAGSFYTTQAERRGFKWAFGACWRDRREREAAVRRQRRFMPAIPNMGPRPAFYPSPGRLGAPGITGGEYDRLPQPFLGGGPGMYPGVGGGLGGLMFGGGRRQGGRGNGTFHLF